MTMSVSQEYESVLATFHDKIEHSGLREDSTEYQDMVMKNISKLVSLKNSIYGELAVFSSNETVEDVPTTSLKFLSIDFYLGLLFSKKQLNQLEDDMSKKEMKIKFLNKTVQLLMQFLVTLQDYEILTPLLSKKLDSLDDIYHPSLEQLYQQPSHREDLSGAQERRLQKIEMFRQSKSVNAKLEVIESKLQYKQLNSDDDEQLRKLYIQRLRSYSYRAFNEIEQMLYEIELLKNFTKLRPPDAEHHSKDKSQESNNSKDSFGYTENLEYLNKPLLSKEGKVLRNFTLVDSRTQLQNKVFGYGQYGPTMSVEEFLQKELEENRILKGGQEATNEPCANEDDMNWQDMETYKARKWDEFKESVPRGSGNTMNRG